MTTAQADRPESTPAATLGQQYAHWHEVAARAKAELERIKAAMADTGELGDGPVLDAGVLFEQVEPTTYLSLNRRHVEAHYPVDEHPELYLEQRRRGYVRASVLRTG